MRRAIIAGGGIGGLTAAHALQQAGWSVVVCEQHPSVRGTGAILGIWPPHMEIFEDLRLSEAILAHALDEADLRLWDPTGHALPAPPLASVNAPYRLPYATVYRPQLNRLLAEPLGSAVRLGAAVQGFAADGDRVSVTLSDGSRETADLLVGADGVGSVVRRQLHPSAVLQRTDQVAWRAVVSPGDLPLPEHHGFVVGRSAARGGWLRVADGSVFWVIARFGVLGDAPDDVRAEALSQIEHVDDGDWGFPLRDLVQRTPPEAIHRDAVVVVPALATWATDRVVLLGDAAHALSPHISSGAAYAIEDAYVLGALLADEPDVSEALQAYDEQRRARLAWVRAEADAVSELALSGSPDYGAAWVRFVGESLSTAPRPATRTAG